MPFAGSHARIRRRTSPWPGSIASVATSRKNNGSPNARHLAQTPFYVNQLVALAIHRSMLDRVGEVISQPNSANLYWALSALPGSLIELDRAAGLEGSGFTMASPAVNDLDRPRDTKEWKKMAGQLIELLQYLDELPKQDQPDDGRPREGLLAKWAKAARAELPRLPAMSGQKVAAMSDEEASIRWYVNERVAIDQREAAVVVLPPREAWPLLKQLRNETKSMHEKTGTKSKESGVFDPASIYVSAWSLKRKIQSLRIIEAVRHYLATHQGQLPATLDQIKGVSIPLDPLTDQAFHWKVDGKTAVLKAPPLPAAAFVAADAFEPNSATARANVLEYRLQVE